MASVDERVVSIQFDNKSFEANVATTLASIDKLKTSLDFTNASKSISNLSDQGKHFSLAGMISAVETIASKFSAMGVVAFSVLDSIVRKAVSAGIDLAKNLSLDQVIAGFKEYETNMNSIQTVMANTKQDGTTLDQVNKALETLNEYSDQTIYNFGEMARNIGTFTAAGVNLDTSVTAIKGIANLAAISGSNSQQASTAMYQLSQALASGSVKLMDWNSIVNAGMGGEVFQKALFETGKALGTIKDVPVDQSFEEWTAAGNTFRGSLEQGWVTADVLTNTLQGFTGDLTDAQLQSMGYNEQQIKQIQEMGQVGKEAATKVKTLTQLIGTVKESIGSGWSATFKTIIGDFEEAKTMFTDFNTTIGNVVKKNADARNKLLQGWKDMGGRTVLIDAIKLAFEGLGRIITVIKAAFHDIFPKVTATRLYEITLALYGLASRLDLSRETLWKVRDVFAGFFALLSIGFNVVKEIVGVFVDLFKSFDGGGSKILDFASQFGKDLVELKKALVDGGGLKKLFDKISAGLIEFKDKVATFVDGLNFGNVIQRIKDFFSDLKSGIDTGFGDGAMGGALDEFKERFDGLFHILERVGNVFQWIFEKLKDAKEIFSKVADEIGEAFSEVPQKIADAFANVNYDQALDTVNTGFFAGLVILIKKFLDNPLNINKGFMKGITGALDELTGTLKAMQTNLKAEALMKIAIALGILTVSLVVLSLMNSAALTKAMVSVSVGLGILIAALTLLNTAIATNFDAFKLALLGASLIMIAAAMTVLAVACKIFATMGWEEISKGLVAVVALLAILTVAVKLMSGSSIGMIAVGIGLMAVAVALVVLATAVKLFAMMSWEELGRGFAAIAGGLLAMAGALQLMPNGASLALQGVGLMAVAAALVILAGAVKLFAMMSWKELGQGFAAIAGGLLIIAGALAIMPNGVQLALQGVGLLLIANALIVMAGAIAILGKMSWSTLVRGLTGLASTLLILGVAAAAMQSNILGAITIGIMAGALLLLALALKAFSAISYGDLIHGLIAIAASLTVLGVAAMLMASSIPALLGLGVALLLIGAAFALVGVGANLLATAFSILATSGVQGVATLLGALEVLAQTLPIIIGAIGEALISLIEKLVEALPGIIANLSLAIAAIIQLVIDNIPAFVDAIGVFISAMLTKVVEMIPQIVATGMAIITGLLQGISDNIEQITTTVITIIVKFLDAVTAQLPTLITAGLSLLVAFIQGITDNLDQVVGAVGSLIAKVIEEIGKLASQLVDAGFDMLMDFLQGITDNLIEVVTAVGEMIAAFIGAVGDAALDVIDAGFDTLIRFLWGITNDINRAVDAGAAMIIAILRGISDNILKVVDAGFDILVSFLNGLADSIRSHNAELRAAGGNIVSAIVDGMTFGLAGKVKGVADKLVSGFKSAVGGVTSFLGIGSPSKLFMEIGSDTMEGFAVGISKDTTVKKSIEDFGDETVGTFTKVLGEVSSALDKMDMINPTITPVIDLTEVTKGAKTLNNMLSTQSPLSANLSYSNASLIASSTNASAAEVNTVKPTEATQIKFEQNNYSPEALTASEIYRQTKNQIALAKEELLLL